MDRRELKKIRDEVRRAAESNWSLIQRMKIRSGSNPDSSLWRPAQLIFVFSLLMIGPAIAICMGIVGFQEQSQNGWHAARAEWAKFGIVPIVAAASGMVCALSFVCFAGSPNERLHELCLCYPRTDRTTGRYIWTRSLIAVPLVLIASLVEYWLVSQLFAELEFNWPGAAGFSILQTAFFLSLVLQAAKKWKPVFESYTLWGMSILTALAGFASAAFYTDVHASEI